MSKNLTSEWWSPYKGWRVRDVVASPRARGWMFPFFREEFPSLAALTEDAGYGMEELLRAFGGVKSLKDCELSVAELYERVASWSPGGFNEEDE